MKKSEKSIMAWCLYDIGNSAFATTVMAVIFPVYFQKVAASGLAASTATAYWGYASSVALLLSAIIAPFLGVLADIKAARKRFLGLFTASGVIASACMSLIGPGDWTFALILLILGTVGFSASAICYDSLLPHLAPPEKLDYISTKGYALGYLGGGTLLAINLLFIKYLPGTIGVRISLFSVAVWWSVFTIPVMICVPEPSKAKATKAPVYSEICQTLKNTFKEIKDYKDAFTFLIAFWFFNDGIGTIIRMAAIFGAQVGIRQNDLVMSLLVTQFVGIPFSILLGFIAQKIGGKKTLSGALIWYIFIACGAYFLRESWHFWVLAISVGMVQGGAQAISRSIYASMLPKARSAEFFGFYDISSKFAGIAGPAIFAIITQITGSSRLAIVIIGSTFIIGLLLLSRVDVARGIRKANKKAEEILQ